MLHCFHAPKIAQRAIQIYPQKLAKVNSNERDEGWASARRTEKPITCRGGACPSLCILGGHACTTEAQASPGLAKTSAASTAVLCGAVITSKTAVRITAA